MVPYTSANPGARKLKGFHLTVDFTPQLPKVVKPIELVNNKYMG